MSTDLTAPIQTVGIIERARLLQQRLEKLADAAIRVDSVSLPEREGIQIFIALPDFRRLFAGQRVNVYRGGACDILHSQPDDDGVRYSAFRMNEKPTSGDEIVIGPGQEVQS